MRKPRSIRLAAAAILALAAHADLIDRIAVSVGNRVITTSDIDREIRVNAFLNGVKPELTPASRRATAERMVEQRLIRRELETSRYPIPETAEAEPVLADFKKRNFGGDEAAYRQALADAGITEEQVVDEILWQRTLLRFIEIRFRPGVRVTDDEIHQYFDDVVAPAARAAHPDQPVALEDFRDQIEEKITGQRVDQEMNRWMQEARKRTEIVFHEEAFQ